MKKILVILLFTTYLANGQSKLSGSAMFTDSQKITLQERYNSSVGKYISATPGFSGDWNAIKSEASNFYADMEDDVYSGSWDNFLDKDGDLTVGITGSEYADAEPTPTKGVTDAIHAAAIDVQFTSTDKSGKALKVFKAILAMAKDDKLDFGNGIGANNPNATYGTTVRFNPNYNTDGNPWFISAGYISNLISDYALVAKYIDTDPFYLANYERVEGWFEDVANWYRTVSDNKLRLSLHVNWRTGNYSNPTTLAYQGSTAGAQGGTHYLTGGSQINSVTWKQSSGVNNRTFGMVGVVFNYGVYFRNKDYQDFGFDFFRAWMTVGVFPDGTLAEWYRSYDGNVNQGFAYNFISIGEAVKMSHTWAVGVENGLFEITDRGRFYDFTTNNGVETSYPAYTSITDGIHTATGTSGGDKNIYKVLINWSKYWITSSSGGYKTIRKAENLVDYNGDNRTMMEVVPSVAYTYFKTTELSDFVQFDGSGYDAKLAGGDAPPSGSALSNGAWGYKWSVGGFGMFQGRTGSYADADNVFSDESNIPVITINGENPMTLQVGQPYIEPGATATNTTNPVVITGTVNTSVAGTYYRYYNVSNEVGPANEVIREVIVQDTPAPPTSSGNGINYNLWLSIE